MSKPILTPLQRKGFKAVERFRVRELEGLMSHLRVFGPLPESSVPTATVNGVKPIPLPNPFLPKKNPNTGKWRPATYSLRRQAALVKLAHATDTLHYLPPGPKTLAFQTRVERLQSSLPAADAALLQQNVSEPDTAKPKGPYANEVAKIEVQKKQLLEDIKDLRAQRAPLVETLKSHKAAGRNPTRNEAKTALKFYRKISGKATILKALEKRLGELAPGLEAEVQRARALAALWKAPVVWVGKVPEKKAGAELGVRLYAGKRRMFKGHLWERRRAKRVAKRSVLMRNMAARVTRYKDYYKKRRPNPLRPPRLTKPPKLPF